MIVTRRRYNVHAMLRSVVRLDGAILKKRFDAQTRHPETTQKRFLTRTLRRNEETEYGKKYGFSSIRGGKEYSRRVPPVTYSDIEAHIERIKQGRRYVLTSEMPAIFSLTSGTTAKPKFIPVTPSTKTRTARLMRQWLYRCLVDHPCILDKSILTITSAAIEGHVSCGIPYGSASGLIYRNFPPVVRRAYVLPYLVGDIENYDVRYFAMARFGLAKEVSVAATPNPLTLVRVAETGVSNQEEVIRSIRDGRFASTMRMELSKKDKAIVTQLDSLLRPDPERARVLEGIMRHHGRLLPRHCRPELHLIGCWLGGSVGFQAEKLAAYYGAVPKRDLGYLASEGCMTLPYEDNTSAGICALENNYYEFTPEESSTDECPPVFGAHELEEGRDYNVLLTNESGLYRYNINDTIRVSGFYNRTPVLSFVRKTRDFLNITGEKIHVNQILDALDAVSKAFALEILQFRVVADTGELRYDFFLALGGDTSIDVLRHGIIPALDARLSEFNVEYKQKRRSRRLRPPCLHVMSRDWEKNIKKQMVQSGKRDIQYKWIPVMPQVFEPDRPFIVKSVKAQSD